MSLHAWVDTEETTRPSDVYRTYRVRQRHTGVLLELPAWSWLQTLIGIVVEDRRDVTIVGERPYSLWMADARSREHRP